MCDVWCVCVCVCVMCVCLCAETSSCVHHVHPRKRHTNSYYLKKIVLKFVCLSRLEWLSATDEKHFCEFSCMWISKQIIDMLHPNLFFKLQSSTSTYMPNVLNFLVMYQYLHITNPSFFLSTYQKSRWKNISIQCILYLKFMFEYPKIMFAVWLNFSNFWPMNTNIFL